MKTSFLGRINEWKESIVKEKICIGIFCSYSFDYLFDEYDFCDNKIEGEFIYEGQIIGTSTYQYCYKKEKIRIN